MPNEEIATLGNEIEAAYEAQPNTNKYTDAEKTKLGAIEAQADKTDAENVAAAGAVMKTDYNSNTILGATVNDTPAPIEIGENRIVGRKTGGNIDGLTPTEVRTMINVENGATANPGLDVVVVSTATEDSPNVITAGDTQKTYSNEGATQSNFHELPVNAVGKEVNFYVQDDAGMTIVVGDSSHFIRILGDVTPVGGSITSNQQGAFITLKQMSATEWAAIRMMGTWTVSTYVPPVGPGSSIVNGLVHLWDAKSYVSGQTWEDQIGSADVSLGNDTNTGADEMTFVGNAFEVPSANDFFKSIGANPTVIEDMHKTQAGNSWSWWKLVKTPPLVPTLDTMFSTAANTGDRGVKMRSDSGGNFKFDHYDGTTLKTFQAAQKLVADTRYLLVVTYDYDTNELKFSVGGAGFQTLTANLTDGVTGAASYPFTIGADADNTSHMEQGAKIYGEGIVDHALTDSELTQLVSWVETYYSPDTVAVASAPSRIIGMQGDTKAYFNVVVSNTGGATVTGYAVQRKLLGADDSTYVSAANTSSGYDITVTGLTNDVAYTFRFAAITAAGQSPWSETVDITPKAEGSAPYDPQYYKITECVLTNGSRVKTSNVFAREITQPAFNTYRSAFFGLVEGNYIFKVPNGGPTTSNNASYTRVELRHLTNVANGASTEDTLKFAVPDIADGHKVITHQIHGYGDDDNPYFKVVYLGKANGTGKVYVLYKLTPTGGDEPAIDLLTNVVNGDIITLRAVFTGTGLSFYVNGSVTPINCPGLFARTTQYYWKRGAYYQSLESSTVPYAVCTVVHYPQSGQYVP